MGSTQSEELKLLRALTRPGRLLLPLPAGKSVAGVWDDGVDRWEEGGCVVETAEHSSSGSGASSAGRAGLVFNGPVCAACDTAGWILPDEAEEGWRLSNAGRIQVRRWLSRGGDCAGATDCNVSSDGVSGKAAGRSQGDHSGEAGQAQAQTVRRSRAASLAGDTNPLDWLRRRKAADGRAFLSDVECDAGERLQRDFMMGQMSARVTTRLDAFSGSTRQGVWQDGELSLDERACDARQRFRAALKAVGPEFADVLIEVCCFEKGLEDVERLKGWPRRSGKVVVQMALRALARHYSTSRAFQAQRAAEVAS